ncbi:hypothetical protein [Amphritea japonica]|uniref:Secreted protein n=1 Tax=Amphritea japonica ATCC BAA-1530 TaxID=1278309 RepID=A0A7R6SU95_9GAMM|nr:hypothetical protein [Amphritea japonica]BBB27495.1 hypothetical protein AMJAP_2909 [Amphritea japonica ATCC BAA-1530]
MSVFQPLTRFIALSMALTCFTSQALGMQLEDPRSAAVYILKQRPLINNCLEQAQQSTQLSQIWSSTPCQQLLDQDPQFKAAWQQLLPEGKKNGLAKVPYALRKPTIETYSEYKQLAEIIARLSR